MFSGVVYDVAKNEIFWAETGRGAWLGQRKLRVAGRKKLEEAVVATGTPWIGKAEEYHTRFAHEISQMTRNVAGIRRYGSAALDLAWVAAGRFDGFWESHLNPWDIAAGMVIVREAGGAVTELNGKGDPLVSGSVLASNADLLPLLEKRLRQAGARPPNVD